MFRHWTIGAFALLLILAALASCAGNSAVTTDLALSEAQAQDTGQFAGLPAIPLDEPSDGPMPKSASWLSSVSPQSPILSHRATNCVVHPDCLVLEGLHSMPVTYMPPPPYFAYAMYQVPLGALETSLKKMTLTGEMEAAGQSYWVALANFSAMVWQFYGPGTTGDLSIDYTTIAYDFTGPAGNMYFVVLVPQAMKLDLEAITLDFDGSAPGKPTTWNVWGRAFDDMALGTVLGGETVSFEDTTTLAVYTTTTAADGNWGTNLPDGIYKFNVTNDKHFFDPTAMMIIEDLPVKLEVNAGNIIYHGPNAAYDGNIIPMPLITLNVY